MAWATASPQPTALPLPSGTSETIRIEPPRGFFELRLREVWAYRELLYFFVWRDVKIRYKQTAIGVLWVILQPVLNMLVFTLFFGRLAKLPSDGLPYPIFYFAALVPWTYFSFSLSSTTNVVVENQRLITKVYFPRLILPISATLSGLVDFAIGFAVLSVFCFAYSIRPTISARFGNRACGRPVAFRAQRPLSRCPLRHDLSRPVLDVRLSRCVPFVARPCQVAVALRPQPHGRCH